MRAMGWMYNGWSTVNPLHGTPPALATRQRQLKIVQDTRKKVMLTTYDEFIARVEALGFMPLSPLLPGMPSLGGETPEELWHTGLDTDPWRWKDRAAQEKRLAYGCILGGHKGFVTRRMYSIFYAAFHPALPMPERWAGGTIDRITWQLWALFEERSALNTSQVRQILGVSGKSAARASDSALQRLQHEYYITIDGSERKISAKGEFYGWPVNRYRRVVDWAPAGWLDDVKDWPAEEARAIILEDGAAMSQGVTRQALAKKLGWG